MIAILVSSIQPRWWFWIPAVVCLALAYLVSRDWGKNNDKDGKPLYVDVTPSLDALLRLERVRQWRQSLRVVIGYVLRDWRQS